MLYRVRQKFWGRAGLSWATRSIRHVGALAPHPPSQTTTFARAHSRVTPFYFPRVSRHPHVHPLEKGNARAEKTLSARRIESTRRKVKGIAPKDASTWKDLTRSHFSAKQYGSWFKNNIFLIIENNIFFFFFQILFQ